MDVYVEPTTDNPFTGEVYLLTSRLSISAAESFALAMSTLPNVTLVGEPTNGVLSDMWFAILPNGWIATLSNERYLSSDGISYERIGVPPDVEVLISSADLETGNDLIVEAALELAQ
jgi:C-terminal processing protease CtpA/Prc